MTSSDSELASARVTAVGCGSECAAVTRAVRNPLVLVVHDVEECVKVALCLSISRWGKCSQEPCPSASYG